MCEPCKQERLALVAALEADTTDRTVSGYLLTEGEQTGDKRIVDRDALSWDLPLPLRRVREDRGAHDGAVTAGAITSVERLDDYRVKWSGKLLSTADGMAAFDEMSARYNEAGLRYGLSVDLDDVVVDFEGDEDDPVMRCSSARLRGATLCDIPAYHTMSYAVLGADPDIAYENQGVEDEDELEEAEDEQADEEIDADDEMLAGIGRAVLAYLRSSDSRSLTAAAPKPTAPPAEFFFNPNFEMPTPLTVTNDGRVMGHLALWETCHTGFQNVCVKAPKNFSDYSYFHTGLVVASNGEEIAVGHISLGGGHADPRAGMKATVEHYDSTSTVVADIAVGEDRFGIYFTGAIRDLTPSQLAELRSAPLSGDWREMRGALELCAALAVVVPGFNVPRTRALVASGAVKSLTASVEIQEAPVTTPEEAADELVRESQEFESAAETPAPDAVEPVAADDAAVSEAVEDAPEGDEPAVDADEPEAADPAELVGEDPAELVPAVENTEEDILAALDALAGHDPALVALRKLDALAGKL